VRRALAAGANAFLPKPFTAEQLLDAIAQLRASAEEDS
jgi:CheY-like chemotaxis protein